MNAELDRLIRAVGLLLDGLPEIAWRDYESVVSRRTAAVAALDELVRTEGARWRERGDITTLSLGGVRTSATGGPVAALRNWHAAAQRKVAGGAA